MLFKGHWTGKEYKLSQTLPIGVRKLFYSNLHSYPRTPEAMKEWTNSGMGCDRSTLSEAITIGMLEDKYVVSEEEYQSWERQSLDIILQGKEHIIFRTYHINSINPEYCEKMFKAYQRYFYVEILIRNAVVNGKM